MAVGKPIMNLMAGQSVPTCVPASLKWTDLTLSVWFLPAFVMVMMTWQANLATLQQPISCLHFSCSPKKTGRKWKKEGASFSPVYFIPFILLVCPSFSPPLFLSLFLSHTCTNTLCKRRLRTDWIIPFVISKGFLLQRLKKIPSKTFPRSSKTFNKGIYRLYFLFTAEIILLSQRTIW